MRLLASQQYRQYVTGVEKTDTSSTVIAEWAKLLFWLFPSPTSLGARGNTPKVLVGHLSLTSREADRVVTLSGKGRVGAQQRGPHRV